MRRKLPSHLLPRALATGRVAGHLGRAAARRLLRDRRDDAEALGEAMATELDHMKGLAMKVGQILSYMDVGLPEGTVQRLARLQRGADPLDASVIAQIVADELGRPVGEAFDSFDPRPVAAASIGQVHRATVDGQPVAVKVRYPGVRATLDGDLSRLRPVARLAGLATAVDSDALLEDLRARMLEECDYRVEAGWIARFGPVVADLPDVAVPVLVPSHCTEAVLTTAWVDDPPLTHAASLPAPRRLAAAQALTGFLFHSVLGHGLLHGDPHPGNMLVGARGLTVLDFGAVAEIPPPVQHGLRALIEAVAADDRGALRRVALEQQLTPRPDRVDFDHLHRFWRWMLTPALPGPHRFDRHHMAAARGFSQPGDPNVRHLALPPPWLWLQRALWGLSAVLRQLEVDGPTAHRLPAPSTPPGGRHAASVP